MKNKPKFLRVGELIAELQKYDTELPVMITREGKWHQYGISKEGIIIENGSPYCGELEYNFFGFNTLDWGEELPLGSPTQYLNLGNF